MPASDSVRRIMAPMHPIHGSGGTAGGGTSASRALSPGAFNVPPSSIPSGAGDAFRQDVDLIPTLKINNLKRFPSSVRHIAGAVVSGGPARSPTACRTFARHGLGYPGNARFETCTFSPPR